MPRPAPRVAILLGVAVLGVLLLTAAVTFSRGRALVNRSAGAAMRVPRAALRAAVSPTGGVGAASTPGTASRREVPLAEPMPSNLPADGPPPGWRVKEFAGAADVELVRTDGRVALHLRSDRTSFALYRDVVVDLGEYPRLGWTWKVVRLPGGGDARVTRRDDQAAQLYVVFPRWPSPLTRSDVLGYVWDTTAPVDTRLTSSHAENVRLIVVESGAANIGTWRRYERNVVEDYRAMFGHSPPRVGKLAVMIDSNDTRTGAEAFVASIGFGRER